MTDSTPTSEQHDETPPPVGAGRPAPPLDSGAPGVDRPELAVGAAFAGGFLLAMILRRLAR